MIKHKEEDRDVWVTRSPPCFMSYRHIDIFYKKTEQEKSPAQLIERYSLFLGLGGLCQRTRRSTLCTVAKAFVAKYFRSNAGYTLAGLL